MVDLRRFGWNSFFSSQCPSGSVGRVALARREHFVVWTEQGELEASASGNLRYAHQNWPCAGDWVVLRDNSVIIDVLQRRTQLSRREPGRKVQEQILANIDVLFIVSGLDHDYNLRRLERYFVLARESGARPVVLLNKADLRSDFEIAVAETRQLAPEIPVLALSAWERWGFDKLPMLIKPVETAALIGSSGVGKSTILNHILGADRQRISSVRDTDSRGRHTRMFAGIPSVEKRCSGQQRKFFYPAVRERALEYR